MQCFKVSAKFNSYYRQPETVFVPQMFLPQMFVPENGQSWQCVGCLLFQASRAMFLLTKYIYSIGRLVKFQRYQL